eukprot:superscaffoldBa00000281_g3469
MHVKTQARVRADSRKHIDTQIQRLVGTCLCDWSASLEVAKLLRLADAARCEAAAGFHSCMGTDAWIVSSNNLLWSHVLWRLMASCEKTFLQELL